MVSRRWLFTLTMCFSPTAYLSCAFSLLLLFFRAQQFLNLFVRVPLVPFIQTRLVPSWSLPDYCTLPVEGRVKKNSGVVSTFHARFERAVGSSRAIVFFFFLFCFLRCRRRVDLYRVWILARSIEIQNAESERLFWVVRVRRVRFLLSRMKNIFFFS